MAVLSSSAQLSQALKNEAYRLGFALAGITTPDPPPHYPAFLAWAAAGRQGEMNYLTSPRSLERRADPRQILPECRAILVLGLHYPAAPAEPAPEGHGRVAAYACGPDYHDLIPPRLQSLVAFLEELTGAPVPHRCYTDTGPLLERDLAQRAGLGWIGKNTCLIHPRQGSYFLLAEILLGLDLEPDPPFATDHCGSCRRCLEACPTQCILPDRTLDARRCLAYLTIELKGPIPLELRPAVGEWVFGCDICQQVCPWNRRFAAGPQAAPPDPAFAAADERFFPALAPELGLTPSAFRQRYRITPLLRAKRRGYLRNLAVALGNRRPPQALPALRLALADEEPLVRGHAAWALGQIGSQDARQALQAAQVVEPDETVQAEIQRALEQLA